MEQTKMKFKGYLVRKSISIDGTVNITKTYLGDTYAVSKAKAINNIKFRHIGGKKNSYTYSNGYDDGIIETYDAELVS